MSDVINYRVDHFYKNNTGNPIAFERSFSEAVKHTTQNQISVTEAEDTEHIEITAFAADTCDMNGWIEAFKNGEIGSTTYFSI